MEPATVLSTCALRAQRYVEIMVCPVEFCPVTRQLSVIDKIEITLNFTNPQGEVRQNVGIFNKVAANTFINYDDDGMSAAVNDKAFKKNGFVQGTVQWKKINNPGDVNSITADYLIICAEDFYPSGGTPHSEVLRLANHRAFYNGFDVMILNVEDIISDAVGFYYEGNPNDPNPMNWDKFKSEQRIRTCIRTLYEEGTANNTGDGKLGYVLLVGDNYANNTGMPMSQDHDQYPPSFYDEEPYPTDYYFSCITRNAAGKYGEDGSLFIGRLSVQNETHLFNMVEKIINFETEYNPQFERKMAGFTYGRQTTLGYEHSISYLNHIEHFMSGTEWDYTFVNYHDLPYNDYKKFTLDYFNNGAAFVQYFGYGEVDKWGNEGYIQDSITQSYFESMLKNYDRTPFVNAVSNWTGQFDNENCLGEFLTRYDPNKGAVGYIGASNNIFLSFDTNSSFTNPLGMLYQERFLFYLFKQAISISGELLLTTKMNAPFYGGENFYITRPYKYAFNLFGDPALNIMAEPDFSECPVRIESTRLVQNGETLIVPSGCELRFFENGKLIVEEGGAFIVEDGAQINGVFCKTDIAIHVKGGDFIVGNNVTFNNLNGVFLENSDNFYDDSKAYNLNEVTLNHTQLIHHGSHLNLSNCNFNDGSNVSSSVSISNVDNCTFLQSTFVSKDALKTERIWPPTTISNCSFLGHYPGGALQINYSYMLEIFNNTFTGYKIGIVLNSSGATTAYYEGCKTISVIHDNEISNCSTGIELYNSIVNISSNNIHNNELGVGLYNYSTTSFGRLDIPTVQPQVISDNNSYELYASHYSFPVIFRFNKIFDNNLGNSFDDPMIYWDLENIDRFPSSMLRDVKFNCWGYTFNPLEDFYPSKYYVYDPIWQCGKSVSTTLDVVEMLFQSGLDYVAELDFSSAETVFKNIIENHSQSSFAIAAMQELFSLQHFSSNGFYELHDYLTSISPSDSNLFEIADFLSTRCLVKEREWQPAINWYENRIDNSPSYQDSVFAVIDLGDIHLMMEEDTTGGNGAKSGSHFYYRLDKIKPKSAKEYEENKSALLASLPQIKKPKTNEPILSNKAKKGSLDQNIPNPAIGITTINYEIYTGGTVEIRIFNAMGQLLQSLPQGTKQSGKYQTKINLLGFPVGLYQYSLLINGEQADAKKMIVN